MPQKMGNGGHGPEDYNANNGQYVEDGIPNSSYDNPDEKILGSMGLTKDELDDFFNFNDDNQNKNNTNDNTEIISHL